MFWEEGSEDGDNDRGRIKGYINVIEVNNDKMKIVDIKIIDIKIIKMKIINIKIIDIKIIDIKIKKIIDDDVLRYKKKFFDVL